MLRTVLFFFVALAALSGANAAPLEDYGKLPGIDLLTLSPSGERYAFVATIGENRRLIVMNAKNELLEQDNVGAVKVVSVRWAGDDHVLVSTLTTVNMGVGFVRQRDELASVVVINPTTHKSFAVFGDGRQGRVAHTVPGTYGAALIDGHWYGYFGGFTYDRTRGESTVLKTTEDNVVYQSLYRVDLDTGEFTLVADDEGRTQDWLVAPSGDVVAYRRFNRKSGQWSVMGALKGGVEITNGRYPDVDSELVGFGRDASKVIIAERDDDSEKFIEFPLAGGAALATYEREKSGDPLFDRTTHLWIGSRDEETASLFDAARAAKLRGALKAFPGYITRLISYSADFSKMIVFTEGGDDSGTYWMVDTTTRAANEIGHPYPTIAPSEVGAIKWVDYKAADGLAMQGVLTLPPARAAKGLPLVVMPHGGPQAHDFLQFDYWPQAFASRGYAVFQPNFRGSDDSGVAFLKAGKGEWGRKMQTDISDGVAELVRQGIVDPKRVCIVGWSYGGYAALAGVTIQQGLYKCAVSYGGVSNLSAQYRYIGAGDTSSVIAREWKADLGLSSTQGNRLEDLSPVFLAARADAPILLIHGKDDTVVQPSQSTAMDKELRGAGKSVKLMILPGADHWLLHEDARITMVKESVSFVLEHNPPDAAPAH